MPIRSYKRMLLGSIIAVALLSALPGAAWANGGDSNDQGGPTYVIEAGPQYPPWLDNVFVNPTVATGLTIDMTKAICAATDTQCEIVVQPFSDCIITVAGNPAPGVGLASGQLDACVDWSVSQARLDAGFRFTDPYSGGPASTVITRPSSLGSPPPISGPVRIGYIDTFAASPEGCVGLTSQMKLDTGNKEWVAFGSNDTDAMIAALERGSDTPDENGVYGIDYALLETYDSLPYLPVSGLQVVRTEQDGVPAGQLKITCLSAPLALMSYPSQAAGNVKRVEKFIQKFNLGLEKIRKNGVFAALCEARAQNTAHPDGALDGNCILQSSKK